MKPPAFVAGYQTNSHTATSLQVGNHATIHAADGLKVSAQHSHFHAQAARPLREHFHTERPAHHLMLALTETEEVVITNDLRPVHRRRREIKSLQKRHGNLKPATGKTIDELAVRAVRKMAYVILDLPRLKVNQIAGQINFRRVLSQRPKPQCFVLETRTG